MPASAAGLLACMFMGVEAYDCDRDFHTWEVTWPVDKKTWCCGSESRGCEAYQCELSVLDEELGVDGWLQEKVDWCCSNKAIFCPTTTLPSAEVPPPLPVLVPPVQAASPEYDCVGNFEQWDGIERSWCCVNSQLACDPWDCQQDLASLATSWPMEKKGWCCEHEKLGCKFDCGAGFSDYESGWSDEQKTWCCATAGIACEKFDCNVGLATWEGDWSADKKQWCCNTKGWACDPYDCQFQLNTWEASWIPAKKVWCCQQHRVGCVITSESTSSSPVPRFDCNAGWDNWEYGWSDDQKHWCCDSVGRACESFECTKDVESWEEKWMPEKKSFCCFHGGMGCGIQVKMDSAFPVSETVRASTQGHVGAIDLVLPICILTVALGGLQYRGMRRRSTQDVPVTVPAAASDVPYANPLRQHDVCE